MTFRQYLSGNSISRYHSGRIGNAAAKAAAR